MMRTTFSKMAIFTILLLTSACSSGKKMMPGSDRDAHGCIPSAGYTWSEVRQNCIRVFADGIALKNAENPEATLAAYVVFSTDGNQAELFLPETDQRPILRKEGDNWINGDYKLTKNADSYRLFRKNNVIFEN